MDQSIILLVVMFAALYFFMIRPENKRKKQAQAMRDGLKKGDVITSIGGIVGKIVMVNPNTIIIETSEDRVRMELTKWAVSQVGVQTGDMPAAEKKDKKAEKAEKKRLLLWRLPRPRLPRKRRTKESPNNVISDPSTGICC